ncbi:MAG TPA: hypothetical protein VF493_14990, partial [Terriglobales bacterium]
CRISNTNKLRVCHPERRATGALRLERKSKDPDDVYVLIAVESFLSKILVGKPQSASALPAFSGSFDSPASRDRSG